jgi:hypothetical protein
VRLVARIPGLLSDDGRSGVLSYLAGCVAKVAEAWRSFASQKGALNGRARNTFGDEVDL